MKTQVNLQNCRIDDVLSCGSTMFKVGKLLEIIEGFFQKYSLGKRISDTCSTHHLGKLVRSEYRRGTSNIEHYEEWFDTGITCEALKIGAKGWQKGRIKINLQVSLEFCPDLPEDEDELDEDLVQNLEAEDSLDDIRQLISNKNI